MPRAATSPNGSRRPAPRSWPPRRRRASPRHRPHRRRPGARAAPAGRVVRPRRRRHRGRRGGSFARACSLSSTRCGTPCRRARRARRPGRRCDDAAAEPARPPGRGRRDPGGLADRLAGATDRGRPRLADPLLRPGLGRHPARGPGPATPRGGRCRVRDQRLRLGPPRERRGPRRRVRARLDHRERGAAGARLPGRRRPPPSMAGAPPAPDAGPASSPRSGPTSRPGSSPPPSAWSSLRSSASTAGRRRPMAGSVAAGTGATCWSTSPSARASRPATSRRRCPTSPACR